MSHWVTPPGIFSSTGGAPVLAHGQPGAAGSTGYAVAAAVVAAVCLAAAATHGRARLSLIAACQAASRRLSLARRVPPGRTRFRRPLAAAPPQPAASRSSWEREHSECEYCEHEGPAEGASGHYQT